MGVPFDRPGDFGNIDLLHSGKEETIDFLATDDKEIAPVSWLAEFLR